MGKSKISRDHEDGGFERDDIVGIVIYIRSCRAQRKAD